MRLPYLCSFMLVNIKEKYENNPHVTIYQFHVEIVTDRKKKKKYIKADRVSDRARPHH